MFASLEVDYEDADNDPTGEVAVKLQQTLTFYELDLGLNHVVRKYSEPLEEHANLLISVPGGSDGPSGVLVCSENYITYKNLGDQPDIRCPIPRRRVSHTLINKNDKEPTNKAIKGYTIKSFKIVIDILGFYPRISKIKKIQTLVNLTPDLEAILYLSTFVDAEEEGGIKIKMIGKNYKYILPAMT